MFAHPGARAAATPGELRTGSVTRSISSLLTAVSERLQAIGVATSHDRL